MNNLKLPPLVRKPRIIAGALFLALLTGCVAYGDRRQPGGVYVEPVPVQTTVVMQDDYVYYPGYNVYYNSYRHQYAYMDRGAWVSRPAPRGVSVEVLAASPSVRMDFHDSPARHHAAVAQKYPKNWTPTASHPGPNENRKDDRR